MDRGAPLTAVRRVDAILDRYAAKLGAAHAGYRNHACRVATFCLALLPAGGDVEAKVAVAAAFHDLGIWTDGTFDYLDPSVRLASAYLAHEHQPAWTADVSAMIANHHSLRPVATRAGVLVEAFRRADWVDVSLGLRRFGLTGSFIRSTYEAFPSAGFHRRLVSLALTRLRSHPLDPLPMVRW